jgi:hypothetical protein
LKRYSLRGWIGRLRESWVRADGYATASEGVQDLVAALYALGDNTPDHLVPTEESLESMELLSLFPRADTP